MFDNVIQFPRKPAEMSDFDKCNEGFLTDEERAIAAENLSRNYAEQRAREALHRGNGREISLEAFAARMEYQAHRQKPTPNAEGVHVGDLFYGSWGYEQTNVDFFQVVALKGKHTAILREIGRDYIGGYAMQGNVRPCRDAFISEETYTVRTKMCDFYNPPQLRLNHPTASGHLLERIDDDREIGYSSYY